MKRVIAAATVTAALAMAGCQPAERTAPPEDAAAAAPAADAAAVPAAASAPAASAAAAPAAPGAPAFAVIYPGGTPEGAPVQAEGPAGPGGAVSFTTDASPETVVAFYRQRAEASGLKPINTMNRGDARAYSAGDGVDGAGKLLSVVATPVEGGPTSVQLMWSAGQ